MRVRLTASLRVGQLTLRNSARVSIKYRAMGFLVCCRRATLCFATDTPLAAYLRLKRRLDQRRYLEAGEAGIEPATYGFGDRCSAN